MKRHLISALPLLAGTSLLACSAAPSAPSSSTTSPVSATQGAVPNRRPALFTSALHVKPTSVPTRFAPLVDSPAQPDPIAYRADGDFDAKLQTFTGTAKLVWAKALGAGVAVTLPTVYVTVSSVTDASGESLAFQLTNGTLATTTLEATTSLTLHFTAQNGNNWSETYGRQGDPAASSRFESTNGQSFLPATTFEGLQTELINATLPSQYEFVSTGRRMRDVLNARGTRTVTYEGNPTMPFGDFFFAAGDLDYLTGEAGGSEVSLWWRKGTNFDGREALGELDRQITAMTPAGSRFPLPVVTAINIPNYSGCGYAGGGVTEFAEIRNSEPAITWGNTFTGVCLGFNLSPYDTDASLQWVEEALPQWIATLAVNSGRTLAAGDLGGEASAVTNDPLSGDPWGNGSSVMRRIQLHVGDTAFWNGASALFQSNVSFSTVTFAQFLTDFSLSAADGTKLQAQFTSVNPPSLTYANQVLGLADPDGTLLDPLQVIVVASDGTRTTSSLSAGGSVNVPAGSWLIVDPSGAQSLQDLMRNLGSDTAAFVHDATNVPWATTAVSTFGTTTEERVMNLLTSLPVTTATGFEQLYGTLTSDIARAQMLKLACDAGVTGFGGALEQVWSAQPPLKGFGPQVGWGPMDVGLQACGTWPSVPLLAQMTANPSQAYTDSQLWHTALATYDTSTAIAAWGAVLANGQSVRTRILAQRALHVYLTGTLDEPTKEQALTLYTEALDVNIPEMLLFSDLPLLVSTNTTLNQNAIAALAAFTTRPDSDGAQYDALCNAYDFAGRSTTSPLWQQFQTVAQGVVGVRLRSRRLAGGSVLVLLTRTFATSER